MAIFEHSCPSKKSLIRCDYANCRDAPLEKNIAFYIAVVRSADLARQAVALVMPID